MLDRDSLVAKLRKKFKSIMPDKSALEDAEVKYLSSGILALDYALGGGFPRGNITHIWGPDGAGKTTSMIPVVSSVQHNPVINGLTLYIANEPKIDERIFYRHGVDPDKVIFAKTRDINNPLDGNKTMNMVRDSLGLVDLIIVDSVAGLTTGVEYDMNSEDYAIGKIANLLSRQLPMIASVLAATDTVLILLNQERANFEQYGKKTKPFAGYALTHWVAVRAWIRRQRFIYDADKVVIGYSPKVTIEKNDFHPPRGQAEWDMNFATGIDYPSSVFTLAHDMKLIKYAGSWKLGEVSLNYPEGKGEDDARARVAAEPDLVKLIEEAVFQYMNKEN